MDLILCPRARRDQLAAALKAPAHHLGGAVGHPDRLELARGEEPRQRTRVEPVGLRPRGADRGVSRRDDDHLGDVWLDQPLDLPGVAGDLERHPVLLAEAPGEELDLLRPGRDPSRRAELSSVGDRHLAELEVDVQSDCPHLLLLCSQVWEKRWANDNDAFALWAHPDKSQGRPLKSSGSGPIVQEPAYPSRVLPEAPVPVSRP